MHSGSNLGDPAIALGTPDDRLRHQKIDLVIDVDHRSPRVEHTPAIRTQKSMRPGWIDLEQRGAFHGDHAAVGNVRRWKILSPKDIVLLPGADPAFVVHSTGPERMMLADRRVALHAVRIGIDESSHRSVDETRGPDRNVSVG